MIMESTYCHVCFLIFVKSWEQDYHLQDPGRLALFDEYLEMSESLNYFDDFFRL